MSDQVSKSWFVVFDNPQDHGYPGEPQEVCERLRDEWITGSNTRTGAWTYCISDKGLKHIHMVIEDTKAMRFTAIKKSYAAGAHFMATRGTKQQAEDYINKNGDYAEKGEKVLCLVQHGEIKGAQGARNDLSVLYGMVKSGMDTVEILEECPQYMMHTDRIDRVRQLLVSDRYKKVSRELDVTYIWGTTGSGKTRFVMDTYGYDKVYRVTDYAHPFDGYMGEDVILFEEFVSSLPVTEMLKYLDRYPVQLSARYYNRQACYTKVYFATNIDLRCQYSNVQEEYPKTWAAFLRRINHVRVMADGVDVTMDTDAYLREYFPIFDSPTPFDNKGE